MRGFWIIRGSAEHLTLTGRRGSLDRVQHAMAPDRVFEGRAEMRPLAIVAGETRVRLRDVGAGALRRRPPILLWHGQDLERRLRAPAATGTSISRIWAWPRPPLLGRCRAAIRSTRP